MRLRTRNVKPIFAECFKANKLTRVLIDMGFLILFDSGRYVRSRSLQAMGDTARDL